MKSASNFGLDCDINSWARRRREWNSSGAIGWMRSPSGFSVEKEGGVCGALGIMGRADAAAMLETNLLRVIGFMDRRGCDGFGLLSRKRKETRQRRGRGERRR